MNRRKRRGAMGRAEARQRTADMLAAGLADYDRYANTKRQAIVDAAADSIGQLEYSVEPWLERVQLHDEWLAGLFVELDQLRRGLRALAGAALLLLLLALLFLVGA